MSSTSREILDSREGTPIPVKVEPGSDFTWPSLITAGITVSAGVGILKVLIETMVALGR